MTVGQIKSQAEAYIGETIAESDAIAAVNEALRVLGDAAEVYAQTTVTTTQANQWVTLPGTATSVVRVEDAQGNAVSVQRMGNQIRIAEPGTYTVMYRRMPNPVTALTDTPEVHEMLHQPIVSYVIGWWKLKEDEENPDGKAHLQQFAADARAAVMALRRKRWPKTVRVIR